MSIVEDEKVSLLDHENIHNKCKTGRFIDDVHVSLDSLWFSSHPPSSSISGCSLTYCSATCLKNRCFCDQLLTKDSVTSYDS